MLNEKKILQILDAESTNLCFLFFNVIFEHHKLEILYPQQTEFRILSFLDAV